MEQRVRCSAKGKSCETGGAEADRGLDGLETGGQHMTDQDRPESLLNHFQHGMKEEDLHLRDSEEEHVRFQQL